MIRGGRSTALLNTIKPDANFTGLYRHAKSNLDLAVYRAYDPDLGRWLSRDSIGEAGGVNLYGYVDNDPLNNVDLDGLLTVHIWNYRGSNDAWGHVSITLEDGTHISWWPGQPREHNRLIPQLYSAPSNDPQTFADDIALERQLPDVNIRIIGLDEDAIEKWWDKYKDENKWKTLSQNCSTVGAEALKAGGGGGWYWWSAHNLIWKPNDVKSFAEKIQDYENSHSQ